MRKQSEYLTRQTWNVPKTPFLFRLGLTAVNFGKSVNEDSVWSTFDFGVTYCSFLRSGWVLWDVERMYSSKRRCFHWSFCLPNSTVGYSNTCILFFVFTGVRIKVPLTPKCSDFWVSYEKERSLLKYGGYFIVYLMESKIHLTQVFTHKDKLFLWKSSRFD